MLLEVSDLGKVFPGRRVGFSRRVGPSVQALRGASFTLREGEVVGIVGESGSGKTTLIRTILRLIPATSGSVRLLGRDILGLDAKAVREFVRPNVRMIFQHPEAVLNPGYTIGTALAKPLELYESGPDEAATHERVIQLLATVGLGPEFADKLPRELSGGEKRRVGLCRALATRPRVILADEPISGLDVFLQERVLAWLLRERARRRFGLVIVSHDLERVNQVCDRVLVMYRGRIVEDMVLREREGRAADQFVHPYSQLLQRSRVDLLARSDGAVEGVGAPLESWAADAADGCVYALQCARRAELGSPADCGSEMPGSRALTPGHRVACHHAEAPMGGADGVHKGPLEAGGTA